MPEISVFNAVWHMIESGILFELPDNHLLGKLAGFWRDALGKPHVIPSLVCKNKAALLIKKRHAEVKRFYGIAHHVAGL